MNGVEPKILCHSATHHVAVHNQLVDISACPASQVGASLLAQARTVVLSVDVI